MTLLKNCSSDSLTQLFVFNSRFDHWAVVASLAAEEESVNSLSAATLIKPHHALNVYRPIVT